MEGRKPYAIAFLGDDIDAIKQLAQWSVDWVVKSGLREVLVDGIAPSPLVEVTVYAGIDQLELARSMCFACEGVWMRASFAGMAHAVAERHEAILGTDLVIDMFSCRSDAERNDYGQTLRLDVSFLAPEAKLALWDAAAPLSEIIEKAVL